MPTFSAELEKSLHRALATANDRDHELSGLEHLLLSLTEDEEAKDVFDACDVQLDLLKQRLEHVLLDMPPAPGMIEDAEAKPTAAFQRVIQRAVIHVQSVGRDEVTSANVLAAIFAERESQAVALLGEFDVTRYDVVKFIARGLRKGEEEVQERKAVSILCVSADHLFASWIALVLDSAEIEHELVFADAPSDVRLLNTHTLAIASTHSAKSTSFFDELRDAGATNQRTMYVQIDSVGERSIAGFQQLSIRGRSAYDVATEILDFLNSYESFNSFDQLFEAATRLSGPPNNNRPKIRHLPGDDDFGWRNGSLTPSPISPVDITLGDEVLKPSEFLNDYKLLASEFAQQIIESNHTSYAKTQAHLLQTELTRGMSAWDPQTIDRRVRTIISLVMKDECPMNAIVRHNLEEISGYQKFFRLTYPIIVDRERAMRSLSIPNAVPMNQVADLHEALQDSEIVAPEVVEKLDAAINDVKMAAETAGDHQPTESKRRATFSLAVMLNSIGEAIKNAPELVRRLEAYRKLYDMAAPPLRLLREWISLFFS